MVLFKYPQIKHNRTENPPAYSDYHKYKPFLKKEFKNACIYCMLTDYFPKEDNFGIEHYRPKKQFPNLRSTYTNLFYTCNCCNRRKGSFWPTTSELAVGRYIPNPCEQIMFNHLKYDKHVVIYRSDTGKFTIDLLDLNDERSLEYRESLLILLESLKENIERLKNTISHLDKRIKNSENKDDLLKKKAEHVVKKDKLEMYLNKILGEA